MKQLGGSFLGSLRELEQASAAERYVQLICVKHETCMHFTQSFEQEFLSKG